MSGFSKYTCRIVNFDTGEVRELNNPECGFIFLVQVQFTFQVFLRLFV